MAQHTHGEPQCGVSQHDSCESLGTPTESCDLIQTEPEKLYACTHPDTLAGSANPEAGSTAPA